MKKICEKKKEDKVNKKNDEIDVADLAKEIFLSKVTDELKIKSVCRWKEMVKIVLNQLSGKNCEG